MGFSSHWSHNQSRGSVSWLHNLFVQSYILSRNCPERWLKRASSKAWAGKGGSGGTRVAFTAQRMEVHNATVPLNFSLPPGFGHRATDRALSVILVVMLLIVMFSLGCTMEFSKIKAHIWKPKGLLIAMVSQYGIMPLTAFVLGKIFPLSDIEALAILICGCSPGGNLSNLFTLAMKGDMNLR